MRRLSNISGASIDDEVVYRYSTLSQPRTGVQSLKFGEREPARKRTIDLRPPGGPGRHGGARQPACRHAATVDLSSGSVDSSLSR